MTWGNVFVESEYAPLRKVVLAQSELVFPSKLSDDRAASILTQESKSVYIGALGKSFAEAFPQKQVEWNHERDRFACVLRKYGVDVVRPRLLTDCEKVLAGNEGCANFFARDPFFVIGNIIIEGSLRFRHRRNEVLPMRSLLVEEAASSGALYAAAPRPDISQSNGALAGPFIEGGDILVLDKTVFVGESGLASDTAGFLWLRHFLEHFGYTVIHVPLHHSVLHLDCALSLVREGLLIVCEEALIQGIPEQLRLWDRISVPFDQVSHLAVNGLPLDGRTYVMDPRFKQIADGLDRRGIALEFVDFEITRTLGGSFRCSTQPFLRMA